MGVAKEKMMSIAARGYGESNKRLQLYSIWDT